MFQLLIVDDEIESLEWLVELFESCGEEIAMVLVRKCVGKVI